MGRIDIFLGLMERNKKAIQLTLGVLVVMIIMALETKAQSSEGFIYGRVYTRSGQYEGQIRWGKGEAFWNDHFDVSKLRGNNYSIPNVNESNNKSWFDGDWSLSSIWENKYGTTTHQLTCQFGDIAEIVPIRSSRATVKFKNGVSMEVSGDGYTDLKPKVNILDEELGLVSLNWEKIERVEFLPTPNQLSPNFGKALFGTVETTRKGKFTGYIQWDLDERLSTDKLDGDAKDGDMSIPFGNITSITKYNNSSEVELKSGRKFDLHGTNDVNSGNRGIIVTVDGIGKINIPWKIFKTLKLQEPTDSGQSYKSYTKPKGLFGTVYSHDDEEITGRIIYDIDEAWEFEFLEAMDDEIEYKIPFRNLKRIKPKNYNYSSVTLRNGENLLLGEGRDISDANDGLLIFVENKDEPQYIRWSKISEIIFD